MEAAELQGAEVDVPQSVVDLLEADVLTGERVADVDPLAAPSDATVAAHQAQLEVRGVLEGREPIGKRSRRRLVYGSGCALRQGLVRPLVVEVVDEVVEATLLGA